MSGESVDVKLTCAPLVLPKSETSIAQEHTCTFFSPNNTSHEMSKTTETLLGTMNDSSNIPAEVSAGQYCLLPRRFSL